MLDICVGILHPGEMGCTVGAAAANNVSSVIWASEGRSVNTVARAAAVSLEDAGTLDALVRRSAVIVSVCPPHAAEEVARLVADLGFSGTYVDANAISPQRARKIASMVEDAGGSCVDGGIVGPPARERGTTRLYLSGPAAESVAQCFSAGPLEAIVLDGPVGAASALKMTYAAYTKGVTALLAAILAVAAREGVQDALLREWRLSQPGLSERAYSGLRGSVPKAWRFVGEMEEIAATFTGANLPGGFHEAAAEVYRRLEHYLDASAIPDTEALLADLLGRGLPR